MKSFQSSPPAGGVRLRMTPLQAENTRLHFITPWQAEKCSLIKK